MCTHACTRLYACLLLENCCGFFHTVSEGEWGLKLHCNSSFEEEWIPLPEANFEEMKSCFAKQVVSIWKPIMHFTGLHIPITSTELLRFYWCFLKLWLLESSVFCLKVTFILLMVVQQKLYKSFAYNLIGKSQMRSTKELSMYLLFRIRYWEELAWSAVFHRQETCRRRNAHF